MYIYIIPPRGPSFRSVIFFFPRRKKSRKSCVILAAREISISLYSAERYYCARGSRERWFSNPADKLPATSSGNNWSSRCCCWSLNLSHSLPDVFVRRSIDARHDAMLWTQRDEKCDYTREKITFFFVFVRRHVIKNIRELNERFPDKIWSAIYVTPVYIIHIIPKPLVPFNPPPRNRVPRSNPREILSRANSTFPKLGRSLIDWS